MGTDYEFLESFCSRIVHHGNSIRWCAIVNRNGVILSQKSRPGVALLLTEEENEEYAATAIARQKTRGKFESKIGRLVYALGRYEKLTRATIPVNENYFMLLTFDVEAKDFDSIITERVSPAIVENKNRFITMNDSI